MVSPVVRRTLVGTVPLLAAALSAGCGGGGPDLAPAGGVVTFADGGPVAGAVVEFLPAGGGPAARGKTDADGRFTLATGGEAGALVGPHRVGVTQAILMDGFGSHVKHMAEKQVVPPRMGSPATSGLTAEVPADGDDAIALVIPADAANRR